MGVKGKLVSQVRVKTEADMFELLRSPGHVTDVTPDMIQNVDLASGQWGSVGSVICWHFTQDGKQMYSKEVIEAIDERKKSITFKAIEGDLLESYNAFKIIVDIDTNGADNLMTWTMEYEKKRAATPEPQAFMDFCIQFCKAVECNNVLVPN